MSDEKYQNKKLLKIAVVIIAVVFFGFGIVSVVSGIANPAAVYCEELGYQYVIKETPEGQRGVCQFPNGSFADGWKFFTGEKGQEHSYCQKEGYAMKTVSDERCLYSSKCAICILKDGTEINAIKLMKLELKPTVSPWNPDNSTNSKTNYFIIAIALIILLMIIFVVYKKIKNR